MSGQIGNNADCESCDGSGRCPGCRGSGMIGYWDTIVCDFCEGVGDCPKCDGTGESESENE